MSSLIIVDEEDRILGYEEKIETHKKGLLHRAFSIFIIDEENKKMFLQQRADDKYHSGGLWSNACCSHPHVSESWMKAIQRALMNELGLSIKFNVNDTDEMLFAGLQLPNYKLYFLNKFEYCSNYGKISENEVDYVFLMMLNQSMINSIKINPKEAKNSKWITFSELDKWLSSNPNEFTSWFNRAYNIVKNYMA